MRRKKQASISKFFGKKGSTTGPAILNNLLNQKTERRNYEKILSEFLLKGSEEIKQDPDKAEPSTVLQMMTDVVLVDPERINVASCMEVQQKLFHSCVFAQDGTPNSSSSSSGDVRLNARGLQLLFRFLEAAWEATKSRVGEIENNFYFKDLQHNLTDAIEEVVSGNRFKFCALQVAQYVFKVFTGFHTEFSLRKRVFSAAKKICANSSEELAICAMKFINATVTSNLEMNADEISRFSREDLLDSFASMVIEVMSSKVNDPVERAAYFVRSLDNAEFRLRSIYRILLNNEDEKTNDFGAMLKRLHSLLKEGGVTKTTSVLVDFFAAELQEKIPKNQAQKRKNVDYASPVRRSARRKSTSPNTQVQRRAKSKKKNPWMTISVSMDEVEEVRNACVS